MCFRNYFWLVAFLLFERTTVTVWPINGSFSNTWTCYLMPIELSNSGSSWLPSYWAIIQKTQQCGIWFSFDQKYRTWKLSTTPVIFFFIFCSQANPRDCSKSDKCWTVTLKKVIQAVDESDTVPVFALVSSWRKRTRTHTYSHTHKQAYNPAKIAAHIFSRAFPFWRNPKAPDV